MLIIKKKDHHHFIHAFAQKSKQTNRLQRIPEGNRRAAECQSSWNNWFCLDRFGAKTMYRRLDITKTTQQKRMKRVGNVLASKWTRHTCMNRVVLRPKGGVSYIGRSILRGGTYAVIASTPSELGWRSDEGLPVSLCPNRMSWLAAFHRLQTLEPSKGVQR